MYCFCPPTRRQWRHMKTLYRTFARWRHLTTATRMHFAAIFVMQICVTHERLFTKENYTEYNSLPQSILILVDKWRHHANVRLKIEVRFPSAVKVLFSYANLCKSQLLVNPESLPIPIEKFVWFFRPSREHAWTCCGLFQGHEARGLEEVQGLYVGSEGECWEPFVLFQNSVG